MNVLTPRGFLMAGGIILLALGVGGMTVLGPTAEQSMLGDFFWLDTTENYAHLLLGVVALAAYFLLKENSLTKWLVILVGVIAAVATVAGFMNAGQNVLGMGMTHLENPADNVLHLVVAVWAFAAAFMGKVEPETAV